MNDDGVQQEMPQSDGENPDGCEKVRGRLMSMTKAAKWLKITGCHPARTLRNILLRYEARSNQEFLVKSGEGQGRRYYVTDQAIREHCPELLGALDRTERDRMDREIGRYLLAIESRQEELVSGALGSITEFLNELREDLGMGRRRRGPVVEPSDGHLTRR